MNKDDFWMEDVGEIALEASELIEKRLAVYGIVLTPEQEDKIYENTWGVLENMSNGNYRHHL